MAVQLRPQVVQREQLPRCLSPVVGKFPRVPSPIAGREGGVATLSPQFRPIGAQLFFRTLFATAASAEVAASEELSIRAFT